MSTGFTSILLQLQSSRNRRNPFLFYRDEISFASLESTLSDTGIGIDGAELFSKAPGRGRRRSM